MMKMLRANGYFLTLIEDLSLSFLAPLILDSSQRLIRAPQGVEGVTHLQKTNSCALCKEEQYT